MRVLRRQTREESKFGGNEKWTLFGNGMLDKTGLWCRHLGLELNALPVEGWAVGHGVWGTSSSSPPPLRLFPTSPLPNPPQLPNPTYDENVYLRTPDTAG